MEPAGHLGESRHEESLPIIAEERVFLVIRGDRPPVEISNGRGKIVIAHGPHGADGPAHESDGRARKNILERFEDPDADILLVAVSVVVHGWPPWLQHGSTTPCGSAQRLDRWSTSMEI